MQANFLKFLLGRNLECGNYCETYLHKIRVNVSWQGTCYDTFTEKKIGPLILRSPVED